MPKIAPLPIWYRSAVFLYTSLMIVTSLAQTDSRNLTLEQLYKLNEAHSFQFKCSVPQPRAFPSEYVFNTYSRTEISTMELVHPTETVLYRCDQAGCCGSRKTCKVFTHEIISLYYRIIDSSTHEYRFESVEAHNHTACSCQSSREKIKRLVHE